MRISLQLWDAGSGELIWSSMAESELASEAFTQDPVFLDDAARVTLGSLMSDLLNRRTGSQYTYLNEAIDTLVREAIPVERKDRSSETAPQEKQ
jgi:hypothetical protein